MSGDILLQAATKFPELVIGIVGIDNLQQPGVKLTAVEAESMNGFFAMLENNFTGTVETYTRTNLFPPSADSMAVNRVVNDFKNSDSMIAVKVLRSLSVLS
jgi:hypothetical protein